ncbi:MAG: hypothetical protein QNJ30_26055 [Kiloniellales bacterium]|nr:hypothetical protein [Kiloniellales bacterium]
MSLGQRLNTIETVLDQLRVAIDQEKLKLAAKGTTPQITDMLYHDFWRRVQAFRPRIESIRRELASMGHAIDLRRRGLWSLPRDRRYSAAQSIGDHQTHLKRVQDKALRVLRELNALDQRGRTPTDADLMKNVVKLFKEGDSFLTGLNAETAARHVKDVVSAPASPVAGGGLTTLGLLVGLIVVYLRRGPRRD